MVTQFCCVLIIAILVNVFSGKIVYTLSKITDSDSLLPTVLGIIIITDTPIGFVPYKENTCRFAVCSDNGHFNYTIYNTILMACCQ